MKRNMMAWAAVGVLGVGLCAWSASAQNSSAQNSSAQSSKPAAQSSVSPSNAVPAGATATASASSATGSGAPSSANTASKAATSGPAAVPVSPLAGALDKARDLYRNWKLQDSLDAYNAVLKSDPDVPMAYIGIARVYLKMKKPDDAYTAANKALTMSPSLYAAHVAMGEVYFRQGQLDDADREFRGVVKSGAPDARAYLGLARVFFANANYRHAVILLDQAHELDPSDPDIQRRWIYSLSRKDRIAELKKFLDADAGDDERTHMSQGLKDMEDAEEQGRACRAVTKVDHAEIPLENVGDDPRYPHWVGMKVHIGDATPKLMLDTGAQGIVLDRLVAEKAGIKHVVDTDAGGIGDQKRMNGYMGVASSIKVGDLEFTNCEVFVGDRRSIIGTDGVIGADVFARYLVDINIPDRKMIVSELPPEPPLAANDEALTAKAPFENAAKLRDRYIAPEMKEYTQIYTFGHDMLIPVRINKGPIRLFLIDTGAFANQISPTAARDVTKVHGSSLEVFGVNGRVKDVYTADNVMLQFSKYYEKANDVVSIDTTKISNGTGTEIAGFLGFSMLRVMEMKIDFRDGLVDFYYKEKK
jgi:cytochrome c-type biogenesis protein CcmH/NrfG